jgi:carboxynorspermidine decarboxylase
MMETKTAGPGAFAALDLTRLPSPCFVVDEVRLEENLACLKQIADASGAQILAALKAFSMWELAGLNSRYLAGSCASGLWEAQLARAHYGGLLSGSRN